MSEEKIPTAQEFLQALYTSQDPSVVKRFSSDLIDFAKLHVEAALKAASEKAMLLGVGVHRTELRDSQKSIFVEDPNGPDFTYSVDKESILKAYPPENIK